MTSNSYRYILVLVKVVDSPKNHRELGLAESFRKVSPRRYAVPMGLSEWECMLEVTHQGDVYVMQAFFQKNISIDSITIVRVSFDDCLMGRINPSSHYEYSRDKRRLFDLVERTSYLLQRGLLI